MASEKLDLIDRKELIKVAERKQFTIADNTHPYKAIMIQGMYFRGIVEDAPTVDAVPVVHARWKYYHKQNVAVCTNCSFERDLDTNFGKAVSCPNCGADMRERNDDKGCK